MKKQANALGLAGPVALELYKMLLAAAKKIGPFREEVKKTYIHLVRTSAFVGVHPRKQHLLLTIKAATPIRSARIAKSEQVSKSRWHLDIKIASAADLDGELLGWLRAAYEWA
jgi:hypothetical protein